MIGKPIDRLKDKGKKAIQLMRDRGMRVLPYNIIYFEGINTDLSTLNNDALDHWNDVSTIIGEDGTVYFCAQATTEPGREYTDNPLNPKGAFRIALNTQFKNCWRLGDHKGQDALVQCDTIWGHRDKNKDGFRTGDTIDTGDHFGINQHTTSGMPEKVGFWSAGCLVRRSVEDHKEFMRLCRAMGYRFFDTVVFDGKLIV